MSKLKALIFVILVNAIGTLALADQLRDIDQLIQNDREDRIQKINQLTLKLNESLIQLKSIQNDLDLALLRDSNTRGAKLFIRNSSLVISAISLIGTIVYQSTGLNPSKIILGGGYSISTLGVVIGLIEQKSLNLSRDEIQKIRSSIIDLEARVLLEKRNLNKEIRLLCLADGGTPETCVEP